MPFDNRKEQPFHSYACKNLLYTYNNNINIVNKPNLYLSLFSNVYMYMCDCRNPKS